MEEGSSYNGVFDCKRFRELIYHRSERLVTRNEHAMNGHQLSCLPCVDWMIAEFESMEVDMLTTEDKGKRRVALKQLWKLHVAISAGLTGRQPQKRWAASARKKKEEAPPAKRKRKKKVTVTQFVDDPQSSTESKEESNESEESLTPRDDLSPQLPPEESVA
jgi:hypothetical protein